MKKLLEKDFFRFCMVGGLGFMINFVLLSLLYKILGFPIFAAQLIAGEIALFSNFLLHHNWTYKRNRVIKSAKQLIIQFHVTSWIAIFGSALLVSIGVNTIGMDYYLALIFSSILALGWNFTWSKFVIWRHDDKSLASGEVS